MRSIFISWWIKSQNAYQMVTLSLLCLLCIHTNAHTRTHLHMCVNCSHIYSNYFTWSVCVLARDFQISIRKHSTWVIFNKAMRERASERTHEEWRYHRKKHYQRGGGKVTVMTTILDFVQSVMGSVQGIRDIFIQSSTVAVCHSGTESVSQSFIHWCHQPLNNGNSNATHNLYQWQLHTDTYNGTHTLIYTWNTLGKCFYQSISSFSSQIDKLTP